MRKCLAAYTASSDYAWPPYINVSREDDGRVTVTIRSVAKPDAHVLAPGQVGYDPTQPGKTCAAPGSDASITLSSQEYEYLIQQLGFGASKPFWQSRSLWAGLGVVVMGALQVINWNIVVSNPRVVGVLVALTGGILMYLRSDTKLPIRTNSQPQIPVV